MYRASCTVYYPDQQMYNIYIYIYIYINNILYTISTATCFSASALTSGSLNLGCFAKVTNLFKLGLNKISIPKCSHGSCLLGGCTYNLDSLMGVILMLVFPVCWYDEN